MAYDKIIPIRSRLDHCMNYVLNREKTELAAVLDYMGRSDKRALETAINCDLGSAYRDMMETKRRWSKTGGVLGYHLIHSYAPGEVTPEEAHAAGVEFASRLLGDRYEAVVSTHLDREHLHCHILFNSVSFVDGKKYQNKFKDYFGDIRGVSNEVSRERGLSVIGSEKSGKSTRRSAAIQTVPFSTRRYRSKGSVPKRRKLKGIRALYFKYLYLLGAVPKRRQPSVSRTEILKFDRYQAQFQYLMKYRIDTASQLAMQYDALQAEIDALEEIADCTGRLRELRRELKLCAQIEADIPKIQEQRSVIHAKTHQDGPDRRPYAGPVVPPGTGRQR